MSTIPFSFSNGKLDQTSTGSQIGLFASSVDDSQDLFSCTKMPKNNFAVPDLSDFLADFKAESSAPCHQPTQTEQRTAARADEMAQFRDIVRQEVQRAVADSERRLAEQIAAMEARLTRKLAAGARAPETPARPRPTPRAPASAPNPRKRPAEESTEIDWKTYANAEPATDSADAQERDDDGTGSDDGGDLVEVPFSQCNIAKALIRDDEGVDDDDFTAKSVAEAKRPTPTPKPKKKRRVAKAQAPKLGHKLANFAGVEPEKRYRLLGDVKSIGHSKWHPGKDSRLAPPMTTKSNRIRHPASMLMASWKLRQTSNGEPVRPVDLSNVLVISELAGLSIDKVMDDELAVKCLLQGWCVAPFDKLNELAANNNPPATLREAYCYQWMLIGRTPNQSIDALTLDFDLTGLSGSELERMQRIARWTRELQSTSKASGQEQLCITSYSKFLQHMRIPLTWPARN